MQVADNIVSGLTGRLASSAGKITAAGKEMARTLVSGFAQPRLAMAAAIPASPARMGTAARVGTSTVYMRGGDTNVDMHNYDEGSAALGLAFVREARRRQLGATMGR
jgi:hypothetical protein